MVLQVLVQTKKALCTECSKRQVCSGHPKRGDSQLRFWFCGYQPLTVNKTILWNVTTDICQDKEDNIKAGVKEITLEGVKWLNWFRVGLFVSSKTKFLRLSRGAREEDFLDYITANWRHILYQGDNLCKHTTWKTTTDKTCGAALRSTWPLNNNWMVSWQ